MLRLFTRDRLEESYTLQSHHKQTDSGIVNKSKKIQKNYCTSRDTKLCQPSILYPAKLPFKNKTEILCRGGGRLHVVIYSSVFGPLETNRMPQFCLTETWFQSHATIDVSILESIFSANFGPISSVSYRNWVFPTCILSYTGMT